MRGVQITLQENPATDMVDVYAWDFVNGTGDRLCYSMDGPPRIVQPGDAAPLFGSFPVPVLNAIAEKVNPSLSVGPILTHLKDAQEVRDRLLTLNEVRLVAGRDPQALNLIQTEHERRA